MADGERVDIAGVKAQLEVIVDNSWVYLKEFSIQWESIIEKECPSVDVDLLLACVSDNIGVFDGEEDIEWMSAVRDYLTAVQVR